MTHTIDSLIMALQELRKINPGETPVFIPEETIHREDALRPPEPKIVYTDPTLSRYDIKPVKRWATMTKAVVL